MHKKLCGLVGIEPVPAPPYFCNHINFYREIDGKFYKRLTAEQREKLMFLIVDKIPDFSVRKWRFESEPEFRFEVSCAYGEYHADAFDYDDALSALLILLINEGELDIIDVREILS